jgi:hypothetical protein
MTTLHPEEHSGEPRRPLKSAAFSQFPESTLARKTLRSSALRDKIVFEFSHAPDMIHQYCTMRENMFISVWGLKHFSGVKDRFDDISDVLVARKGLLVIAGGRLTVATPSRPVTMPLESPDFKLAEQFPDLNLSAHSYGEFSRLAILPEFRAGSVFPELAQRFIRKAVAEGVDFVFNMAPLPLARSYRQAMQMFGLSWKMRNDVPVPDREEFEGIKMIVSVMDLRPLRSGGKELLAANMPARARELVE